MKVYHTTNCEYSYDERNYIKVGAYGTDDLEYEIQSDGSVYLPEVQRTYSSLSTAYEKENELWIEKEEKASKIYS